MKIKAKVEGIKELRAALAKYNKDSAKAYREGLAIVARELLRNAQFNTPVDTGALKASGQWWIMGSGWNSVAVVGFGNPVTGFVKNGRPRVPADYAVFQHDLPYERKYLEEAVNDIEDRATTLFWQILAI
jgi:hypothetical protein